MPILSVNTMTIISFTVLAGVIMPILFISISNPYLENLPPELGVVNADRGKMSGEITLEESYYEN
jgi:hypothetical protein